MTSIFKKAFFSVSLFTFVALIPLSCGVICNDSCGCGPTFEVKDFNITEMEALTLVDQGQQVSPSGTYPFDEVVKGIRIKSFQTIAVTEPRSTTGIPGVAYACSPPPPQSASNLADVKIINLKEVILPSGESLKVGDDISSYFGMNYYFEEGTRPIPEFLEGTLELFADDFFKLAWVQDPVSELNLVFTIRVQLESGLEFSLTDEILNIR